MVICEIIWSISHAGLLSDLASAIKQNNKCLQIINVHQTSMYFFGSFSMEAIISFPPASGVMSNAFILEWITTNLHAMSQTVEILYTHTGLPMRRS